MRIWEVISGRPHQHHNAAMVSNATHSLTQRANELEQAVRPYSEADDPLVMFMTDVFNRRAAVRDENESAEFHS